MNAKKGTLQSALPKIACPQAMAEQQPNQSTWIPNVVMNYIAVSQHRLLQRPVKINQEESINES